MGRIEGRDLGNNAMTPAERDKMARKLGYRDFAEYSAKQKVYGKKGGSKIPDQTPPRNIFEKIPIHPASILRKVSDRINKAIGE